MASSTINYQVGEHVYYVKNNEKHEATIVAVTIDELEHFYTIIGTFGEKQTLSQYLSPRTPVIVDEKRECHENPSTFEEIEMMEKLGNDNLVKRNYSSAIMNFSVAFESIVENTNLHVILSNRSQAYLMKNDAKNAFKDAELCVLLQPNFSTGYLRKGLAQIKLGRQREGLQTFREAMEKFPLDKAIQDAYQLSVMAFKESLDEPPKEETIEVPKSKLDPKASSYSFQKPSTSPAQGPPQSFFVPPHSSELHESKTYKQRCREAGILTITAQTFCEWLAAQPGGEIRAQDMVRFYERYPELRNNIGKLSMFCRENSRHLHYQFRGKVPYVSLKQ